MPVPDRRDLGAIVGKQAGMGSPLGSDDDREGAFARLQDAISLGEQERWVGAIYLAGRAVEAFLRSLLWLRNRQQEVSHDLQGLLRRAHSLGMLDDGEPRLQDRINEVAVIWHNNLRFVGDNRFLRDLRSTGRDRRVAGRRITGDALKANAKHMLEVCEEIVARAEVVWKRCRKS